MALEGDLRMKGFRFKLDSTKDILARRGLEGGGKVQRYVDSEVLRLSEPYTPHRTGALTKSAQSSTTIGSGEVKWNTPYTRYLYRGKLMVSPSTGSSWTKKNETKVLTSVQLRYHGGGKRGKLWFERMKADHKSKILRGAALLAGGKTSE